MPMLTTVVIGRPVWPRQSPVRTWVAKAAMRPRTWCTSGTTLRPSAVMVSSADAEGDVEDGSVFGDVDVLAGPHGVDAFPQAGPFGDGHEEADGVGGEAVLGVVEVQVRGVDRQVIPSSGVAGEQLPQVDAGELALVVEQGLPFGGGGDAHRGDLHSGSLPDGLTDVPGDRVRPAGTVAG